MPLAPFAYGQPPRPATALKRTKSPAYAASEPSTLSLDDVAKNDLASKSDPQAPTANVDSALSIAESSEPDTSEVKLEAAEPAMPKEAVPTPESHVPNKPAGPIRVDLGDDMAVVDAIMRRPLRVSNWGSINATELVTPVPYRLLAPEEA